MIVGELPVLLLTSAAFTRDVRITRMVISYHIASKDLVMVIACIILRLGKSRFMLVRNPQNDKCLPIRMQIRVHPSTIWLTYKAVFIDDSLQVFQVYVLGARYF